MCSSDTDFNNTADITMLPPTSVQLVGTSFTKIQTHIGPSVNSKSIKSVNSAANRCFAAIRNNVFTVADKSPPRIKQISKSFQEINKLFQVKTKATSIIIKLDKIKVGSISNLRFRRIIMA